MIAFDDSRWPIVAVTRDGAVTMADATAQIIALDNLLRRREPFALLITHESDTPPSDVQGAHGIATRWLTANHELLQTWCRGIATVDQQGGNPVNDPLAAIGSPRTNFADAASAEAWLNELLAASPALADRDGTTD